MCTAAVLRDNGTAQSTAARPKGGDHACEYAAERGGSAGVAADDASEAGAQGDNAGDGSKAYAEVGANARDDVIPIVHVQASCHNEQYR